MAQENSSQKDYLSVNTIYRDYEPAVDNLYTVELFNLSTTTADPMNDYIRFHATNITYSNEQLKLSRNQATRLFCIGDDGGYTLQDVLTITWRESSDFKVKKYHEDWLKLFYNRETDQYQSCSTDDELQKLKRKIKIKFPKPSSGKRHVMTFTVLPQIRPGVQLGWKDTGSVIKNSMTYYVEEETSEWQ